METKEVLQGKKVLIVDDEVDVLDSLTELLSTCMIDRFKGVSEARSFFQLKSFQKNE